MEGIVEVYKNFDSFYNLKVALTKADDSGT